MKGHGDASVGSSIVTRPPCDAALGTAVQRFSAIRVQKHTGDQHPPPAPRPNIEAKEVGRATMRDTQADVPSAGWRRAQLAFKDSMVHGILQFTPSIAFRYVLHRCESRDIRCRESFCVYTTKSQRAPEGHTVSGAHGDARGRSIFLGASRAGVWLSEPDELETGWSRTAVRRHAPTRPRPVLEVDGRSPSAPP